MSLKIENTYNCIKDKFGLENFSGTKLVRILQDFYDICTNALAILTYENNKNLARKNDIEPKYIYRINENQTLSKIYENLIKDVMCGSETKSEKIFVSVWLAYIFNDITSMRKLQKIMLLF